MRLVVFDMDGTLIDSAAAITKRVLAAFDSLGLPAPSEQLIRSNVGLSLPIYMGAVAETDDPELVAKLFDAYRAVSAKEPPGQMPLFEGARAVLESLSAQPETLLAVATGKGRLGLQRTLDQCDLGRYFTTLQTADNNPSKPHPGMLLSAMTATGIGLEATVMIGDAVFDIDMAKAAGVPALGVSWGMQSAEDLRQAGATAIVANFAEMEATIDAVLETSHA